MKHKKKKNGLIRLLKVLCCLLLVGAFFATVSLKSNIVTLEYSINKLEKKKQDLLTERKLLAAKSAKLLSVNRVEKTTATSGFSFPDRTRVVYVQKTGDADIYKASYLASRKSPPDVVASVPRRD